MLHDPARHEPLLDHPWDEARARDAIARIVRETVQALPADGWWPPHPRDVSPGEDPALPLATLYDGAIGVVWALRHLHAVGAATVPTFAGRLDDLAALDRRWLASIGMAAPASYLMGELPVAMMAWDDAPSDAGADRVEALAAANLDAPARELMWGSPGSLLAAAFMHERSGDARWAALFRRVAARLHEQLQWSQRHQCFVWTQDLYGRTSRYLDAVHGFVATARTLVRGRELLDAADWQQWQRRIEQTIANTAIREEGRASWPVEAEEPPERVQKKLMQFCHGAPGFVICLADLPGTALDGLLAEAGEATWAAGPLAKGANLCHGTAGNGYAFLALHARTRDARWLARARAFAMHAIHQFEREAAGTGRLRHSLWTGDPGLAIYLWDCLHGQCRFPTLDVFFA